MYISSSFHSARKALLAADAVYEFAFIGTPLKIRGGDAAPLRPLAIPYE